MDSKTKRLGLFLANPMVAKLNKINEHDNTKATAKGITVKTIFLLLLTIVGIAIFFATNDMVPKSYMEVEGLEVNVTEAIITVGGLLIAMFFQFIAFKFVKTSMILGSLYSLIQGYALAFICHLFGSDYVYPALFALGLTIVVVITMLFLYRAKLVKVDNKFISVIVTTIVIGLILTILYLIMSSIPYFDEFTNYLNTNSVIFIITGLLGIIISSLFLLVDFEVLRHCVEDELPKKYEWLAAYALSFSVIELYLKIFNFIIRLTNQKK